MCLKFGMHCNRKCSPATSPEIVQKMERKIVSDFLAPRAWRLFWGTHACKSANESIGSDLALHFDPKSSSWSNFGGQQFASRVYF